MRGADRFTESLFTVSRLEDFIPADHPLRPIRALVNQALVQMDVLFSSMYAADVGGGLTPLKQAAEIPQYACT